MSLLAMTAGYSGEARGAGRPDAAVTGSEASVAEAPESVSLSDEHTFGLGTVEIIGQRVAADIAVTTDKVTADVLAARHRDDLSEALDLIPGMAIQNTGQRRERTIALRGFTSRQVPLFIDGVPVYVPYDGNVDLSRFGVGYISEIVVSKGLASLLYGPNTLGGAVNVVSRKPVQPLEVSGRAEIEANNDFDTDANRVDASIGGNSGTLYGIVTGSYGTSNGYRLPDTFTPVAAQPAGDRLNAVDRDTLLTAKLGYQHDADEYALSYYRQVGAKHDPPYAGSYLKSSTRPDGMQVRYWNWPYWIKESIYFVARNEITSKGTLRWRVFNDSFRNSLNSFDDATYSTHNRPYAFYGSVYNDFTYGGSADFEWAWDSQNVTRVASHFRNDVHREFQAAPALPVMHLDIPTYDVAIEHEWRPLPALSVTPSYSYMIQPGQTVQVYNSNVKRYSPVETDRSTANNGQLVVTYQLDGGPSLFGGVSRKTRFPTIKERFSGGLGSMVPNPGLKPETALHVEVGLEQQAATWNARLSLFQSRLHDAVQSVSIAPTACATPPCSEWQNVGKQRNRGVEVSGGYSPLDTLHLQAEVDVLQIDFLNNPSLKPLGTPGNKYRLMGDWEFLPKLRVRADWQHEAARYSTSTGTRVAGSFDLVNAFLRYEPLSHLGLELGVRNATDALYAYEEGFYEPGRTYLAQVDFQLE
jgi:iron complex outermembrane receptor protein